MDLAKHLASYRASVLRDALGESTWYSQQLPTTDSRYPKIYDYLNVLVGTIKQAADRGDVGGYKAAVNRHQDSMIKLFEAMVSDHLWDYRMVSPNQLLDMIDEQGVNWFKFARRNIKFVVDTMPMQWIPRYIYPWFALGIGGEVVAFDADELAILRSRQDLAKAAFVQKKTYPALKIMGVVEYKGKFNSFKVKEPWLVNSDGVVRDWTAPLFDVEDADGRA